MVFNMKTLDTQKAKEFYDDFGEKQDKQSFYEDTALTTLLDGSHMENANRIFEYGCGTGRFAAQILSENYAAGAYYLGIDISDKMVLLAKNKLESFGTRAEVKISRGETRFENDDSTVDRFVSTYVLDLLDEETIRHILTEAQRILEPNGLLCLAGVTRGVGLFSKVVMKTWETIFRMNASFVGGCRPIELLDYLHGGTWEILLHETVVSFGIASEVLVAKNIKAPV